MEKSKYVRTDLALELKEDIDDSESINGVRIKTRINSDTSIKETVIEVMNVEGEAALGKPIGSYITLESDMLRKSDESYHEPFTKVLMKQLSKLIGSSKKLLVIGLGNREVTPDALGPYVVDNLYITRHLLSEGIVKEVREISAICPGVMAQTGIETQVLLKAICEEIKPDIVIAVDALAAREPSRLNTTIQLCDTGISPGSGVGNNRMALNKDTLGVKVIALGVPTVISVPAIVNQCIDNIIKAFSVSNTDVDMDYSEEEKYQLACELLEPKLASMFVTPKDIDEAVKRVSYTISEAINGCIGYN